MGAALLAGGLALTACSSATTPAAPTSSSTTQAMTQAAPAAPQGSSSATAKTGTFVGVNGKHVAGTVSIANGQLTLSGFSSDEGPDLHLYLANGTDENAITAGKELGNIVYDKASQTFTLNGVDASQYTTVAIHCDKAKATFGAATLS